MKYGVIDVGSNSVRLLISENGATLFKLVQTTRLAKGMNTSHVLCEESIKSTLLAISFFVKKANELQVDKIYCFATSAVRTAENSAEFVSRVYNATGLTVDVVDENTEAEIGYLGALSGKDGGIIDIGGGSAEIQAVKSGDRIYRKSLQLGAVRLTDECGQDEELLSEYIENSIGEYGDVPKVEYYAIGGTATSVASMLLGLEIYDPKKVDGCVVDKNALFQLKKRLFEMSVEDRKSLKGLQPERADIIASGIALLCAIMEYVGLSKITISERDNLEGYLYKVAYEQKD